MFTFTASSNPIHTQSEAGEILRVNPRTLERWRTAGIGPVFVKIGRRVAYRRSDLDAWVEQQRRSHTNAVAPPAA